VTGVIGTYEGPRIDSHMHLWERAVGQYSWLRPDDRLFDDFPAARAATELALSGIGNAILVQADDTERDTRFLLDVAEQTEWATAVVGWVPLADPAVANRQLDGMADRPLLRGVREMIHITSGSDYLARGEVVQSLAAIASRGLAFDIPDAWPRHLHAVPGLADALPELTIVLDHLGKPPDSTEDFARWRSLLLDGALRPNVVAKFSGLSSHSTSRGPDATRALLDLALNAFGAERICWGSDWPVSTTFDDYAGIWSGTLDLVSELSESEQREVLFGAAARAYRLTPSPRSTGSTR
jgi:L-fuconolactonase